jgi:hypothetical protein
MWVVLCSHSDVSARHTYEGLRRLRAPHAVELVTADDIESAPFFKHRIGSGGPRFDITLGDGRSFSSDQIDGVLNRLLAPSRFWLTDTNGSETQYAYDEFQAIYTSWLNGLGVRVINRPSRYSLCGPFLHSCEWTELARQAGFKIRTSRPPDRASAPDILGAPQVATRSVLVLRERLFGTDIPCTIQQSCFALAHRVGVDLLGIELIASEADGYSFSSASACPPLPAADSDFLQALAETLTWRRND